MINVVEEIEIFKSVVKMKNIGEIAFQLGSSLLESSRHGESLNYLLLAKSKRPRHSATLNNLGVLQFKMGRVQEARRTMKRSERLGLPRTKSPLVVVVLSKSTGVDSLEVPRTKSVDAAASLEADLALFGMICFF